MRPAPRAAAVWSTGRSSRGRPFPKMPVISARNRRFRNAPSRVTCPLELFPPPVGSVRPAVVFGMARHKENVGC